MGRYLAARNQIARPPTSIVNGFSTTGWTPLASVYGTHMVNAGAKVVLSGALTANTLATMLTITGSGVVEYVAIGNVASATARTMRIKLTIDGVAVFDSTSASASSANVGAVIIGGSALGTMAPSGNLITFNTDFKIEIASSLTETDLLGVGYKYRLTS